MCESQKCHKFNRAMCCYCRRGADPEGFEGWFCEECVIKYSQCHNCNFPIGCDSRKKQKFRPIDVQRLCIDCLTNLSKKKSEEYASSSLPSTLNTNRSTQLFIYPSTLTHLLETRIPLPFPEWKP